MTASIDLLNDEQIVFSTQKHWMAPARDSWIPALMIVGAFVLGWITPDADAGIGGFFSNALGLLRIGLFVGGLAWIAYNVVAWRTAKFVVTNVRVVREEGLIGRRSSATMLSSVTDVQSRVGLVGRTLGYGDLLILGPAGEKGSDRFTSISKPIEFRDQMMSAAHDAKTAVAPKTPRRRTKPPVALAPAQSQADELATIAKLAELRDAGAISPEEFEAKKAEILARV